MSDATTTPPIDQVSARPPRKPVGITKGPGKTTHEYTFVSRDDEQVLKNGEHTGATPGKVVRGPGWKLK